MEFKGYKITENNNGINVENVRDFNPVHTFECGQCFRWHRNNDGSYNGVVKGRVVNIDYRENRLRISNTTVQEFIDIWFDYLDLGRDYSEIKDMLRKDPIMEKAIEFGYGIRILKQDIWETLVSFILSANNRIPMIMKTVESFSTVYGEEILFNGTKFNAFPDTESLSALNVDQLSLCGGGFRCKYILETSRILKEGKVDLKKLTEMGTDKAREELMIFPGVGPKVADCVLLYSGTKQDVFPTDVWVKRVMEELYFKREASFKEIQNFAAAHFGEMSGFAQQYLFYYARENRIGT